jgi:DNA-binding MurR/RpiR family transcriptional regulator
MNERLDSWHQQQSLPDRAHQSLLLEIDAITHVYQLAQGETFLRIAQQLAHAEAVYILGIQSTRGIANAFLVTWNICDLKSATPKAFPAVG